MQDIFRLRPGVVSPEAATFFRGPAGLRSSGFRQEALELALTCHACDACVRTAVGFLSRSSIISEMAPGPRVKTQTDTCNAPGNLHCAGEDPGLRSGEVSETQASQMSTCALLQRDDLDCDKLCGHPAWNNLLHYRTPSSEITS